MSGNPQLRPAVPEDAPAICAIWNPLIETSTATFTTQFKTPEGIEQAIADNQGGFTVAESETGEMLGFATYFPFRSGPGYAHTKEHSIHLSPSAQGKGVGRALMQCIEQHAKAAGVHSLIAGITGENPAGVAFHAALGYREIARLPEVGYKFGRWMDLVMMQKFL